MTGHLPDSINIGSIDVPVLVFGGPYSNIHATQAVLTVADTLNIPMKHIICTGDLAAYCAYPQETVDLIRDNNIRVIMGNCEQSLASGFDDCGCGFEQGSSCDLLSAKWFSYSQAKLSDKSKRWMKSLPPSIVFSMEGRQFRVIHGGVKQISRFIFPSTPEPVFQEEFHASGTDGIIAGHSGIPFTKLLGKHLWHNPGVVGMPANDGTPRVWFSVLAPTGNGVSIQSSMLNYDVSGAVKGMRSRGCVEAYANSLENGIWPSDEIMPFADRNKERTPLQPDIINWKNDGRLTQRSTHEY